MKMIVLTDIHANLPALDTVLEAIKTTGYDEIIHLGDAVGLGPYPAECLERLFSMEQIRFIMGNHDAALVDGFPTEPPDWVRRGTQLEQHLWTAIHQTAEWTADRVDPQLISKVATWPSQIRRTLAGVNVLFQHYALDTSGRDFKPHPAQATVADLDQAFKSVEADLIFYGHVHQVVDLTGRARYLNPGALGCSPSLAACYFEVEFQRGTYTVTHHCLPYDHASLLAAFEARKVPGREWISPFFFGNH